MANLIAGVAGAFSQTIVKCDYLLRETWLGVQRGGWLNWAAISTLMVLLFLVGISFQLSWGLDTTLKSLGSQVEISTFLKPDTSADSILPQVESLQGVAAVRTIGKDEAWQDLLEAMGNDDPQALRLELGSNPLVDSLRIRAASTDDLEAIATQVKQLPGIDAVYYGSEVVKRLGQLQEGIRLGTMAISMGLTLTTVAVITTTIRLIVLARRREIEVMALVGATSTWIYMPFFLQGIFFGVVGAIAAWFMAIGAQKLMGNVLIQLLAMPFLQISEPSVQSTLVVLPAILLGIGTILGATGSLIAVRKTAIQTL